jgi:hypothetical protein
MDARAHRRPEPWIASTLALIATAGCLQLDPGTSGGGGSGGTGGTGSGTGVLDGTDAEVCGAACDTLIGCGVELDLDGCKASCLDPSGTGLVACFRQVPAACNPLSSCVLSTLCGSGGVPAGSASCESGQSCLASCAGSPDGNCGCSCIGQVSSDQAAAIYAVAVCASVHCSFECGASGGDPGSCQGCLANVCETADLQCQ